jgi:hypothetical protein
MAEPTERARASGVDGALGETRGIVIRIPPETSGHRRTAMLLATIGTPPRSADGPAWRRQVLAICRAYWADRSAHDPAWRSTPGTYIPEEFEMSAVAARKSLAATLGNVSRALAAADVLAPYFKRAFAKSSGLSIPALTRTPSRKAAIEAVLDREAAYRIALGLRSSRVLPDRMPESESTNADKNFATRNLRPFRPVWHLIAAFGAVFDQWARHAESEAQRHARAAAPPVVSPRIDWWYLAQHPFMTNLIIEQARFLEPAVQHLELEHARESELVRLRIG